jgi:hypothetical protein
MKIKYSRIALAWFVAGILLTACGGGGGGGASKPLASTTAISSYMSTEYSSDQITLATDLQAVVNKEVSLGAGNCSANELVAVASLKETHVQTFLITIIAFIQLEKANNQIDKSANSALFNTYLSDDLAWITSSSTDSAVGNCSFTAAEISANGYVTAINSYYANAITQLNAM